LSHLSEEQVLLYPLEHGDSVLHGEVPSPSTVPAGIVSELKTQEHLLLLGTLPQLYNEGEKYRNTSSYSNEEEQKFNDFDV
jgi:hypothetical protein